MYRTFKSPPSHTGDYTNPNSRETEKKRVSACFLPHEAKVDRLEATHQFCYNTIIDPKYEGTFFTPSGMLFEFHEYNWILNTNPQNSAEGERLQRIVLDMDMREKFGHTLDIKTLSLDICLLFSQFLTKHCNILSLDAATTSQHIINTANKCLLCYKTLPLAGSCRPHLDFVITYRLQNFHIHLLNGVTRNLKSLLALFLKFLPTFKTSDLDPNIKHYKLKEDDLKDSIKKCQTLDLNAVEKLRGFGTLKGRRNFTNDIRLGEYEHGPGQSFYTFSQTVVCAYGSKKQIKACLKVPLVLSNYGDQIYNMVSLRRPLDLENDFIFPLPDTEPNYWANLKILINTPKTRKRVNDRTHTPQQQDNKRPKIVCQNKNQPMRPTTVITSDSEDDLNNNVIQTPSRRPSVTSQQSSLPHNNTDDETQDSGFEACDEPSLLTRIQRRQVNSSQDHVVLHTQNEGESVATLATDQTKKEPSILSATKSERLVLWKKFVVFLDKHVIPAIKRRRANNYHSRPFISVKEERRALAACIINVGQLAQRSRKDMQSLYCTTYNEVFSDIQDDIIPKTRFGRYHAHQTITNPELNPEPRFGYKSNIWPVDFVDLPKAELDFCKTLYLAEGGLSVIYITLAKLYCQRYTIFTEPNTKQIMYRTSDYYFDILTKDTVKLWGEHHEDLFLIGTLMHCASNNLWPILLTIPTTKCVSVDMIFIKCKDLAPLGFPGTPDRVVLFRRHTLDATLYFFNITKCQIEYPSATTPVYECYGICKRDPLSIDDLPQVDQQAYCYALKQFFYNLFPNDPTARYHLSTLLYYALAYPGNPLKNATIWIGKSGNNGKSTCERIMEAFFEGITHGAKRVDLTAILQAKQYSHDYGQLPGYVRILSEVSNTMWYSDHFIKWLKTITGGDIVNGRNLYASVETFMSNKEKLVVVGNVAPPLRALLQFAPFNQRLNIVNFQAEFTSLATQSLHINTWKTTTHPTTTTTTIQREPPNAFLSIKKAQEQRLSRLRLMNTIHSVKSSMLASTITAPHVENIPHQPTPEAEIIATLTKFLNQLYAAAKTDPDNHLLGCLSSCGQKCGYSNLSLVEYLPSTILPQQTTASIKGLLKSMSNCFPTQRTLGQLTEVYLLTKTKHPFISYAKPDIVNSMGMLANILWYTIIKDHITMGRPSTLEELTPHLTPASSLMTKRWMYAKHNSLFLFLDLFTRPLTGKEYIDQFKSHDNSFMDNWETSDVFTFAIRAHLNWNSRTSKSGSNNKPATKISNKNIDSQPSNDTNTQKEGVSKDSDNNIRTSGTILTLDIFYSAYQFFFTNVIARNNNPSLEAINRQLKHKGGRILDYGPKIMPRDKIPEVIQCLLGEPGVKDYAIRLLHLRNRQDTHTHISIDEFLATRQINFTWLYAHVFTVPAQGCHIYFDTPQYESHFLTSLKKIGHLPITCPHMYVFHDIPHINVTNKPSMLTDINLSHIDITLHKISNRSPNYAMLNPPDQEETTETKE